MLLFAAYIGCVGALLVLVAFVLSSLGKLSRGSYRCMAINGVGSAMLIYYALDSNSIIFIALNAAWLSIEFYYLAKKILKK